MKLIEITSTFIPTNEESDLLLEMSASDVQFFRNTVQDILQIVVPNVEFNCSYHFDVERVQNTYRNEGNIAVEDLVNTFAKLIKSTGSKIFKVQNKLSKVWVLKDYTKDINIVIDVRPRPAIKSFRVDCITVSQKPCKEFVSDKKYPESTAIDVTKGRETR